MQKSRQPWIKGVQNEQRKIGNRYRGSRDG